MTYFIIHEILLLGFKINLINSYCHIWILIYSLLNFDCSIFTMKMIKFNYHKKVLCFFSLKHLFYGLFIFYSIWNTNLINIDSMLLAEMAHDQLTIKFCERSMKFCIYNWNNAYQNISKTRINIYPIYSI